MYSRRPQSRARSSTTLAPRSRAGSAREKSASKNGKKNQEEGVDASDDDDDAASEYEIRYEEESKVSFLKWSTGYLRGFKKTCSLGMRGDEAHDRDLVCRWVAESYGEEDEEYHR